MVVTEMEGKIFLFVRNEKKREKRERKNLVNFPPMVFAYICSSGVRRFSEKIVPHTEILMGDKRESDEIGTEKRKKRDRMNRLDHRELEIYRR